MGILLARLVVAGFGLLLLFGGIAIVALGGPGAFLFGAATFGMGAVMLIGAAVERMRYRSEAAERGNAPHGPGGGEPPDVPIEVRFQRTGEVFTDPTSGTRMRVFLDPRTGERRYVAEG